MNHQQQLLIHAVKAVRYRFLKAVSLATPGFGDFKVSGQARSPAEIIRHMTDLARKTTCFVAKDSQSLLAPEPLSFDQERERFLICLTQLLTALDTGELDLNEGKKLLLGPVFDMATHVGQIAILSGLNGQKIPKEDYDQAIIE